MKFNQDTSFIVGETYCKYWVYDITKPLVVTFAPAGSLIRKDDIEKNPSIWGFDFVKQEGLNVLSFMAIERNHWYLFPEFQEFLKSLKQEISIFKIRLGYGASMGGVCYLCVLKYFKFR